MTNEEAKKIIKDAFDMTIEALEKQAPKKPEDTHHCPNCGRGLPIESITSDWCKCCYKPEHCPECGQAIDWSDEDE